MKITSKALTALTIIGVALVGFAIPASAHEVLVSVKTECDKPTAKVVLQNTRTDLAMSFTSNVPISGIKQPVPARGTVTGTVPVEAGKGVTLTVNATWPDGFKQSATATAPAPTNCKPTTTTTPPTTTTPTTVVVTPTTQSTTTTVAPTTTVLPTTTTIKKAVVPKAPKPTLPNTGGGEVLLFLAFVAIVLIIGGSYMKRKGKL